MDANSPATKPLSSEDKAVLQKLSYKAWITFLRLYLPLFLLLVYIYFKMQPGGTFRGRTIKYSRSEFSTVFPFFAGFFGLVFLFFAIKDFRRLILPFLKETKLSSKYCHSFLARKYHDVIYDNYLLFYPGKEDIYIRICAEDFSCVGNGEEMYLEVAAVTGEVLYLKCGEKVFKDPEEFSYSDR